jgi:hypothetical protein
LPPSDANLIISIERLNSRNRVLNADIPALYLKYNAELLFGRDSILTNSNLAQR